MKANNKIIAEFMGDTPKALLYRNVYKDYDSSWDLLMPVIKKCLIGQTEVSRGLTNTNVSRILDALCYQDISRTYKAVIEFIKDDNNGR